jgi:hypothetical protein
MDRRRVAQAGRTAIYVDKILRGAKPTVSTYVSCPFYPRKQTFVGVLAMSGQCHEQTHAPQQKLQLFDHLVGEQLHRIGDSKTERPSDLKVDY